MLQKLFYICLLSLVYSFRLELESTDLCLTKGAPCYLSRCNLNDTDQDWILTQYLQSVSGEYVHRNWWSRNKTAGRVNIDITDGILYDRSYHRCGTPTHHEIGAPLVYYFYCSRWKLH